LFAPGGYSAQSFEVIKNPARGGWGRSWAPLVAAVPNWALHFLSILLPGEPSESSVEAEELFFGRVSAWHRAAIEPLRCAGVSVKIRRIALFFSVRPEAREWFTVPPTWEKVGDEMIRRKIAVYSGSEKTGHYASFSKEMDFYSYFWKLTLGEETFTISRSTVDHIYGDD